MTHYLPDHLESFLGEIVTGYRDSDGTKWPYQIVEFHNKPFRRTKTFCTLGLSHYPLQSCDNCEQITRQELMLMGRPERCGNFPALLHCIAMEAYEAKRPYLHGQVLGPNGPIQPDIEMTAFYVTQPVYLPDEFAHYKCEHMPCYIKWLVPITSTEAEFIKVNGGDQFEDLLCKLDPDLLDLCRASVI